jgi:hypothetical protein
MMRCSLPWWRCVCIFATTGLSMLLSVCGAEDQHISSSTPQCDQPFVATYTDFEDGVQRNFGPACRTSQAESDRQVRSFCEKLSSSAIRREHCFDVIASKWDMASFRYNASFSRSFGLRKCPTLTTVSKQTVVTGRSAQLSTSLADQRTTERGSVSGDMYGNFLVVIRHVLQNDRSFQQFRMLRAICDVIEAVKSTSDACRFLLFLLSEFPLVKRYLPMMATSDQVGEPVLVPTQYCNAQSGPEGRHVGGEDFLHGLIPGVRIGISFQTLEYAFVAMRLATVFPDLLGSHAHPANMLEIGVGYGGQAKVGGLQVQTVF